MHARAPAHPRACARGRPDTQHTHAQTHARTTLTHIHNTRAHTHHARAHTHKSPHPHIPLPLTSRAGWTWTPLSMYDATVNVYVRTQEVLLDTHVARRLDLDARLREEGQGSLTPYDDSSHVGARAGGGE